MRLRQNSISLAIAMGCLLLGSAKVQAGVIFGNTGLNGGHRWDAAPRTIGGNERSLQGGLRYSLQGNSFQAYRDTFTWNSIPTVADFQQAVQTAFNAWATADPVSGFTSPLSFVADLATTGQGVIGGINPNGAEIDLFGVTDARFWDPGNAGTQGETWFGAVNGGTVTLTSGTTGYAASAITGADIYMNSNTQAVWSLDVFRRVLTHEIGHAIGLGDVENANSLSLFIDDNFDNTNSTTVVSTLNNNWVSKVNALNPAASVGLSLYTVPSTAIQTTGVDILMESNGVGIGATNPLSNLVPLTNDDYSTRYFLYPTITAVPEPSSSLLLVVAAGAVWLKRRRGSQKD